jgi:uncharacterized membrane protein YeaQ/YmgE (transglycosylase-associated protein family)
MTLVVWLVLGLIAGFLASVLMGAGGYGLIGDIVVGILGSIIGGWLATQFLGLDVTGLNLTSVLIAVGGAIILIVIFRALTPGRSRLAFLKR